jgi:hypothetical protein
MSTYRATVSTKQRVDAALRLIEGAQGIAVVLRDLLEENERLSRTTGAIQEDVGALLGALGLPTHARDKSPREVIRSEVLPAVNALHAEVSYLHSVIEDAGLDASGFALGTLVTGVLDGIVKSKYPTILPRHIPYCDCDECGPCNDTEERVLAIQEARRDLAEGQGVPWYVGVLLEMVITEPTRHTYTPPEPPASPGRDTLSTESAP